MVSMVLDDVGVSRGLVEAIDVLRYDRVEQASLLQGAESQMGR